MSNQAILVSNLKKSYDGKEVLKDVSFSVPKGIIYALLGSNGAGKTTTIRILTTQIPADGGKLQIEGYSVSECPQKVRQIISLTGQFSAVDAPYWQGKSASHGTASTPVRSCQTCLPASGIFFSFFLWEPESLFLFRRNETKTGYCHEPHRPPKGYFFR